MLGVRMTAAHEEEALLNDTRNALARISIVFKTVSNTNWYQAFKESDYSPFSLLILLYRLSHWFI